MFVAALVSLHVAAPHGGPEPVVLGVLPWDLAFHLGWMAVAMVAVAAMTSRALWPDHRAQPPDDAGDP